MKNVINRILRCCGSRLTVSTADGTQTVRAFLQPVTERGRQAVKHSLCDLGQLPQGSFLYIGPAGVPLSQDDAVAFGGEDYTVMRAERLFWRDEAVYQWAIVQKCGGVYVGADPDCDP